MRLKTTQNEDCSDAFNMRSSCKMHDDHFLLVCFVQGSYRALQSSAGVVCSFPHTLGMCWLVQQNFGSCGLLIRSLEVLAKIHSLYRLVSLDQVRNCLLIGIPRLLGFLCRCTEDPWIMSLAPTNEAIWCQGT